MENFIFGVVCTLSDINCHCSVTLLLLVMLIKVFFQNFLQKLREQNLYLKIIEQLFIFTCVLNYL